MGVRPVFAPTTETQMARFATSVAPDSPSSTSTSATGARSPAPRVPTAATTMLAWAVGSSDARKNWYDPRMSPAAFIPDQFAANVESG